jgi:hypothetical protein
VIFDFRKRIARMRNMNFSLLGIVVLFALCLAGPAMSAELLDVVPVVSTSSVSIEVTADISMTYTYYRMPGQARAVVDIADADPEKIEPLIVVNKGVLSSISVDKVTIANMTVSRLVFNLITDGEFSVRHTADRKKLTISFGGGSPAALVPARAAAVSESAPATTPEIVPEPQKQVAAAVAATPASKAEEEDLLGLDEPKPAVAPASSATSFARPEPVVPVMVVPANSRLIVNGIEIGSTFIDIQTNGMADGLKQMKLVSPERLVLDIPGVNALKVSSFIINKFGVQNVRVGVTPGNVRIVMESSKAVFPSYSVEATTTGVRVNFK